MKTHTEIAIINVASQLGAGLHAKGHGWVSRVDGIQRHLETCGLKIAGLYTIQEPREQEIEDPRMRYHNGVFKVIQGVYDNVASCLANGITPVVLGGDHSVAIGSVSAVAAHLATESKPLGLLWVDAHIDMNTRETTPSGNIHGMALAMLLGKGSRELENLTGSPSAVQPEHSAVVGFRFADTTELPNVQASGPAVYSIRDIDKLSLRAVMEEVLARIASNTAGFHLSLDLDALDPSVAQGVNTPFPGGMTFREVRMICDLSAATGRMLSMDIVEHNPEKGKDELMVPLIAELVACAFGASAMPETPWHS